jgi:hypothetical protein
VINLSLDCLLDEFQLRLLMDGEAARCDPAVAEQYAAEHYCYSRSVTLETVPEDCD